MPRFSPQHCYPLDLTGEVIFDDPRLDGQHGWAYAQPEIITQPGAACERLFRRGFGIAPPLPTPPGALSKDARSVLLYLSRTAAQPLRGTSGRPDLDKRNRSGLTTASIATLLGWMSEKRGRPHPDTGEAGRLLEEMIAAGLLVRLGQGKQARYTTPQIAGTQPIQTCSEMPTQLSLFSLEVDSNAI